MTVRYGDIKGTYGTAGANSSPSGGQGTPSLQDVAKQDLGSWTGNYANTTALQASLAADRVDGQVTVKLDTYDLWVWKAADATAPDATHIKPTDVTNGRWVAL